MLSVGELAQRTADELLRLDGFGKSCCRSRSGTSWSGGASTWDGRGVLATAARPGCADRPTTTGERGPGARVDELAAGVVVFVPAALVASLASHLRLTCARGQECEMLDRDGSAIVWDGGYAEDAFYFDDSD